MEVKQGNKKSELGVIPEDWAVVHIGALEPYITSGSRGWASYYCENGSPFIRITNLVRDNIYLDLDDLRYVQLPANNSEATRTRLEVGDILISITADIGIVGLVTGRVPSPAYINQHIALVRLEATKADPRFVSYYLAAESTQRLFRAFTDSGAKSGMSLITVGKILVALPPTLAEQEAIAEALSDADTLIESLEQLLVKKRHIKQGAMQELLTGKKRLPGFSGDWVERPIGEISTSSSEKNSTGGALPVLTCSKHFGFVDSLGFFKNQVFSRNLSTYKIIRGGQIGYPANHIEEGSIGLQDLYEVALVSPIYIVFSVTEGIDPFFVHRLLKLDSYRTKFSTATNASVNRRGSLRWPEFSTIEVSLPRALEEQLAVSLVIRDMESDIALTEDRLKKTRQIKQGMMQELLTGRIRLV
jgi:type I restriction enzyme S subunit